MNKAEHRAEDAMTIGCGSSLIVHQGDGAEHHPTYRCTLPSDHAGCHFDSDTGVSWSRAPARATTHIAFEGPIPSMSRQSVDSVRIIASGHDDTTGRRSLDTEIGGRDDTGAHGYPAKPDVDEHGNHTE